MNIEITSVHIDVIFYFDHKMLCTLVKKTKKNMFILWKMRAGY